MKGLPLDGLVLAELILRECTSRRLGRLHQIVGHLSLVEGRWSLGRELVECGSEQWIFQPCAGASRLSAGVVHAIEPGILTQHLRIGRERAGEMSPSGKPAVRKARGWLHHFLPSSLAVSLVQLEEPRDFPGHANVLAPGLLIEGALLERRRVNLLGRDLAKIEHDGALFRRDPDHRKPASTNPARGRAGHPSHQRSRHRRVDRVPSGSHLGQCLSRTKVVFRRRGAVLACRLGRRTRKQQKQGEEAQAGDRGIAKQPPFHHMRARTTGLRTLHDFLIRSPSLFEKDGSPCVSCS